MHKKHLLLILTLYSTVFLWSKTMHTALLPQVKISTTTHSHNDVTVTFQPLKTFFFETELKNQLRWIMPLVGSLIISMRIVDKNDELIDSVRQCAAGGLLSAGFWELSRNLNVNYVKAVLGLGIMSCGMALLSFKDIKTFFGLHEGESFNLIENNKKIEKNSKYFNEKIKIERKIFELAEEGKKYCEPFFLRFLSILKKSYSSPLEEVSLIPKNIRITRLEFMTNILPYLRTKANLDELSSGALIEVFSYTSKRQHTLSAALIKDFLK